MGGCYGWMLIGACNPMPHPIYVFRHITPGVFPSAHGIFILGGCKDLDMLNTGYHRPPPLLGGRGLRAQRDVDGRL